MGDQEKIGSFALPADFRMPAIEEIEEELELSKPGWKDLVTSSQAEDPPAVHLDAARADAHSRTGLLQMNTEERNQKRRAVVIGASIAGLLTARVLSDHFDEVQIIDRDRLPDGPEFRNGVPQSRHAHALLRGGLDVLDRLFPGFAAELEAAGAVPVEPPRDMPWFNSAGWSGRFEAGLSILCSSRELTESLVRRRVRAIRTISITTRTEVMGLTVEQGRVTGVRIRARAGSHSNAGMESVMPAELVVDASGRMSRLPDWLEQLGCERPRDVIIKNHLGYASRVYDAPRHRFDWKGLLVGATPEASRGGIILPLEGGRWLVTLAGYGRANHPPIDDAGYLEFARSLRTPFLFEALLDAEPIGHTYGYARTENVRRHYELLSRRPRGLIVVGDATCCFNPVYGQGMSVAGLEAVAIDGCFRRSRGADLASVADGAQRAIASACNSAWLLATGEDLRYATTEGGVGRTRRIDRAVQRYVNRVILRSNQDQTVCRAFTRVMHLVDPPATLFKPRVMARVLLSRPRETGSQPAMQPALSDYLTG